MINVKCICDSLSVFSESAAGRKLNHFKNIQRFSGSFRNRTSEQNKKVPIILDQHESNNLIIIIFISLHHDSVF